MNKQINPINNYILKNEGNQFDTVKFMTFTARKFAFDDYTLNFIRTYKISPDMRGLKKAAHILFLNTRFEADPLTVQYIRTLKACLVDQFANCVDYSTALASVCVALNIPCAFVMASTDPNNPLGLNHIYLIANKIPIDLVLGQNQDGTEVLKKNKDRIFNFGLEYDTLYNKKMFPINYTK